MKKKKEKTTATLSDDDRDEAHINEKKKKTRTQYAWKVQRRRRHYRIRISGTREGARAASSYSMHYDWGHRPPVLIQLLIKIFIYLFFIYKTYPPRVSVRPRRVYK